MNSSSAATTLAQLSGGAADLVHGLITGSSWWRLAFYPQPAIAFDVAQQALDSRMPGVVAEHHGVGVGRDVVGGWRRDQPRPVGVGQEAPAIGVIGDEDVGASRLDFLFARERRVENQQLRGDELFFHHRLVHRSLTTATTVPAGRCRSVP